jgi:hypothetical protein
VKIKVKVAHTTPIATSSGPAEREFKVGEVVDLPDLSAQLAVMAGKAVFVDGAKKSAEQADGKADKPAARASRAKKSAEQADGKADKPAARASRAKKSAEQADGEPESSERPAEPAADATEPAASE